MDDESLAVSAMLRVLKKNDPDGTHFGTVKADEFLEYVRSHPDLDIRIMQHIRSDWQNAVFLPVAMT